MHVNIIIKNYNEILNILNISSCMEYNNMTQLHSLNIYNIYLKICVTYDTHCQKLL